MESSNVINRLPTWRSCLQTFSGHTGPVYAVAINPKDPTMMLTGGGDDRGFFFRATNLPQPGKLQPGTLFDDHCDLGRPRDPPVPKQGVSALNVFMCST